MSVHKKLTVVIIRPRIVGGDEAIVAQHREPVDDVRAERGVDVLGAVLADAGPVPRPVRVVAH